MRINIPPVTRALLLLTISFSFLYVIAVWSYAPTPGESAPQRPTGISYLALIPAKVLFHPWTIVTSVFVEQNILTLLVNTTAVFFSGRYLERAWGSKDFAIVVAIAAITPNILVIPTYAMWALMGDYTRVETPITGAITLQAAFLVAFKQLVPEHTVSLYKGLIKIRVKHFPAIFLLLNTLSGIILGTDTALLLGWYGLVTTWAYLRFFKHQPDLSSTSTGGAGVRGDASETFAFATFFPDVMQPPIAIVCNQLYILFCNMKVIKPFSDEAIATGNEQAAARGEGGLPSLVGQARGARPMSKREEAERRRALALQALDQRLNAASARAPPATSATAPVVAATAVENETDKKIADE